MKYFPILLLTILTQIGCDSASHENNDGNELDSAQVDTKLDLSDASGLKIDLIEAGTGASLNKGDIVSVHYTGKLASTGEVFDSSIGKGRPFSFALGKGQVIKGWDVGIAKLNVGAKAVLHIPANMGYGDRGNGSIPPNSDLEFEVEIMDVQPAPEPISHTPFDLNGLEKRTTDSGIEYYIIEDGEGKNITAGSKVKVHYYGYFPESGEKFDDSFERGRPIDIIVGQGQVIPGWEEALTLLNDGSKGKFIIPSALAYGERGYPGFIPPNSDLAFDMQIMKVE